ncbi:MAG TPA: GGDEF domain-containing protein, partial [Phycisphaeraceae bacterium]|nr:GGDEF domain-containing protein [Phycisphaeraceae bacterium]
MKGSTDFREWNLTRAEWKKRDEVGERRRKKGRARKVRQNSFFAQPGQNLGIFFACCVTVGLIYAAQVFTGKLGVSARLMILLAAPPAIFIGWLVGDFFVLRPLSRRRQRILNLARRLRLFGDISSRETFSRLIDRSNDEIGELSRAIHETLTNAHRHNLENARIKRDFQQNVQKATKRATIKLTRMSQTDELTGLANRRAFDQALDELFQRSRTTKQDLACVSMDMDGFKQLNDTLGHAAGDVALRCLGHILSAATRHGAFASRTGGDEFILLLPGCSRETAKYVCDRLTRLFSQHPQMKRLGTYQPTLSYGIASLFGDRPQGAEELLRISDEAMYQAK